MDADPDDLLALRTAALKSIQGKKVSSKKRKKQRKVAMVAEDEDLNALRLAALMTRRQQNQQITVIQKVAPANFPPPRHRVKQHIPRHLVKPSNNLISLTPGPEQGRKTVPQPLAVRVVSTIPSKPAIPTKVPEVEKRVPDKFRRFDGDSSSDEDDLLLEGDGFMESTLDEDDDGSDKESVKSFSSVESVKNVAIDIEADFSDAEQSEDEELAKNQSSDSSSSSSSPEEESLQPVVTDHTTKIDDMATSSKTTETSSRQAGKQRQRSVSITEPPNAVKSKPISQQAQHIPTPISKTQRSDSDRDNTGMSDISSSSSEDEALPHKSKVTLKHSRPQGGISRRVSVSGKDNSSKRDGVTSDLRSKLKSKKVPDDKSTKRDATRENFTVDVNKERRIILKDKKSSEIEISRENEKNNFKSKPQTVSLKRTSQSSRDIKSKPIVIQKDKNTNQRKFIDKTKSEKKPAKTVHLKTSKTKERKRQQSPSTSPSESSYTTSEDDDDEIIGTSNRFSERNRRGRGSTTSRTSAHDRRRFIKRVYNEEDQQPISTAKPIYSRLGNTKSSNRESRDVFSRIDKNRDRRKAKQNKRVVDRNRSHDDRHGKKRRNVSISKRNQEPDSSDDILEKRIQMIKEKNARILRRQREIEMEKKKYG